MGITYTEVEIENTFDKRRLKTRALVDSGSVFMTVPAHLALQLGFNLEESLQRTVTLADGTCKSVPMVGPVRVHFGNRCCDLSVLVLGNEPLFGAVPMEMMDLVLHPASQELTVNPANPFIPGTLAKAASPPGYSKNRAIVSTT